MEISVIYGCREYIQNADAVAQINNVVKYTYVGDYDVDVIYFDSTDEKCVYITIHYGDLNDVVKRIDDTLDVIIDSLLKEAEKLALALLKK